MSTPDPFRSSSDETHAEMMQATYDALQKHGYADLTIQRIGDEFPKSKSLIYQHYDTKDDLLVAFLEFMLDHLESMFDEGDLRDPEAELERALDGLIAPPDDDDRASFGRAVTALRGQAPYDERFRARFTETEDLIRGQVADVVRAGVEDGAFAAVDPDEIAEFAVTTALGTEARRATTERGDPTVVRRELEAYLRFRLGLDD